ncbi:unnamed protein product, partial [Scytosiphon promiscuus]
MPLQTATETYQGDTAPRPPQNNPVFDLAPPVDLTDPTVFSSRGRYTHEAFAEMREKAPVMWHPEQVGAGFWAVTSYDLVKKVELDPVIYSSQRGGILMTYGQEDTPRHPLLHSSSLNSLINLDRPYHTTLRMEHMQFFRPGFVAELRKRVDVQVNLLLDAMEKQ